MRNLLAMAMFLGAVTMGAGCAGQSGASDENTLGEDVVSDGKADGKPIHMIYHAIGERYLTSDVSTDQVTQETTEQPTRLDVMLTAKLNIIHLDPGDTLDATAFGHSVAAKIWFRQLETGNQWRPSGVREPLSTLTVWLIRNNEDAIPGNFDEMFPGAVKGAALDIGVFPVVYDGSRDNTFDYEIEASCTFNNGPKQSCRAPQ